MQRKDGYYRVKDGDDWIIALFENYTESYPYPTWWVTGWECSVNEDNFTEIDETPINAVPQSKFEQEQRITDAFVASFGSQHVAHGKETATQVVGYTSADIEQFIAQHE